ncbi:MAG: hypothetical protein IJU48_05185 [Synergistaceae bacterium]|nr:hypothetical protein [Synergistaceae bacterium]
MTDFKIKIKSKKVYEPEKLDGPIYEDKEGSKFLIISSEAHEEIKQALEWGKYTEKNCVEQGGILLGRAAVFNDKIYCFVKKILLADTQGSPCFLEFTMDMWRDMHERLDVLNENLDDENKLIILGWFHTHPGGLAVFMSGVDMNTQRLNFSLDWQASLVMNPHKNKLRVFFGMNADEGIIIFE